MSDLPRHTARRTAFALALVVGWAHAATVTEEQESQARRLVTTGMQALDANDADTALERCSLALKIVPAPTAYLCVGRAHSFSKRFASAHEAFEAATRIRVTDNDPPSWARAQRDAQKELPKPPPLFELATGSRDAYWLALDALERKDLALVERTLKPLASEPLALYALASVAALDEDDSKALELLDKLEAARASGRMAEGANALRATIAKRTAYLVLSAKFPPDSLVAIDGKAVPLLPGARRIVRPGHHEVVVRSRGMAPQVAPLEFAANATVELDNKLQPLKPWKVYGYSSYGAAALLAGGAIYFGMQASAIDAELAKVCEGSQCPAAAAGRMSDLSDSSAMAMGLGIGAAVVAATGVTFQILAAGETDQVDETRRSLELRGSAKGIDVLLRF